MLLEVVSAAFPAGGAGFFVDDRGGAMMQGNRMKYEQIQGIPEILTWMLISSCRRLLAGWDYGRFEPRSDFAKRQGCYGRFVSDAGESAGRVG